MSKQTVSRRSMLRAAATAAMAGPLSAQVAQHVHAAAAESRNASGGVYKPKALTAHEFETLQTLCEITVPGARKAGAAEFVDILSSGSRQMAAIFTGGIAWIDAEMRRRYETDFLAALPEKRTALLDVIAYRKNASPALNPGIQFFDWVRRMSVDAYYTGKEGIAELGYKGNSGMREFQVPAESLQYALKRSPFA
ncbi:MAG: gluconate 2-dehydrogenase subunit 3 family protein [Candidatus Solibacter usitatus]|nr:gluconate 2-dehydrogenase subunit 3 family protein [Candidatus Solibacter usitatus]